MSCRPDHHRSQRNGSRVLLACFSRAGQTYYYDGGRVHLDVGNTEILAGMMGSLMACDVHRIDAGSRIVAATDRLLRIWSAPRHAEQLLGTATPLKPRNPESAVDERQQKSALHEARTTRSKH